MRIIINSSTLRGYIPRFIMLIIGLFIVSNGVVLNIRADLGVNPWDIFHIGLANQTGLSIGRITQIVGFTLIAISYFMRVRFNVGTIINVISVGFFIDMIMYYGYIPETNLLLQQMFYFIFGVALIGLGIAIYISAGLGAGPRDSLMLALTKTTRFSKGTIRTFMEVIVVIVGYFLGGPLGIGTVVFALTLGIFMTMGFSLINFLIKGLPAPEDSAVKER